MAKQRPNVLVTGTPGTGKSTTCEQIAEATGLQYVDVGGLVKSQELHSGWDDEYSCYIIDEDKAGLLMCSLPLRAHHISQYALLHLCHLTNLSKVSTLTGEPGWVCRRPSSKSSCIVAPAASGDALLMVIEWL